MPAPTKVIPFPSRARLHAVVSQSHIGEFAALSEIILNKRVAADVKHMVLPARAVVAMTPSPLI
jgi:hypothetical protein